MSNSIDWSENPELQARFVAVFVVILVLVATVAWTAYSWQPKESSDSKISQSGSKESDLPDYGNMLDTSHDSDILYGSNEKYDWNQSETEVELFVKLRTVADYDKVRARDFDVIIRPSFLKVSIRGQTLIEGDLFDTVEQDECSWQMDINDNGDKVIWITLFKAVPTVRNKHWKCVIKGDAEVNVAKLGPPVHGVDTSSPDSIKDAIKKVGS